MDKTILWLKRDLRVEDNPALALAAERGAVLPLYVFEPEYWALPDTSARQFAFLAETVCALQADFARIGQPLTIRTGDAVDEILALIDEAGADRVVSTEETGNHWTYQRDLRMAAALQTKGVPWTQVQQDGVVRGLVTRDGWAARRNRAMKRPAAHVPSLAPIPDIDTGCVPSAADVGLVADPCPARQTGGRGIGLTQLSTFLSERGQPYRAAMSSPVAGERACSRLSPYLALGAISVREAVVATATRQGEVRGTRTGWVGSLRSFQSRLAWRDHFMQKLESEPEIETRCLHPDYEGLRPLVPHAERLAAWERGETGIPFVDACMRYLAATGWLNFRMRSMLVAVASYHLWLDWRSTGPHLARAFTDYEPGIHWSQMQMQSGTTGMNTVRIYNPLKQGRDQDPTGAFTRKWVPELAGVPDRHLQEPWTWEGADNVLGRAYPRPIIDVAAAARVAREAVWGVRKTAGFRDKAAAVIDKHASRKEGGDRAPRARRRKAASHAQMRFDFG